MIGFGVGGTGVLAHWVRRGQPDLDSLNRMHKAAPHRGASLRVQVVGEVGIGVTGDGEPTGIAGKSTGAVAFGGVIDNAEAFDSSTLEPIGGDSTAALILASIEGRGFEATVKALRGNFALVYTDGRSIWCSRDQVGFSALFYRDDGVRVWIGSEAKQIVAGANLRREPNLEVIERTFFGLTDLDMPAALEKVERVPRHHALHFTGTGSKPTSIFDPAAMLETSSLTIQDVPDVFHKLMDQAVRRVMRGPDGIALSGGIDSPAVAAYAAPAHREMFGTPLAALSSVFPRHPSVDERRFVEPLAAHFGMPLSTREPVAKPTDGLEQWVLLLDGPFPVVSISESAELYAWARAEGVGVLITGEFAEFVVDADGDVLSHLMLNGRMISVAARLRSQRAAGMAPRAMRRHLARSVTPRYLMKSYKRVRAKPTMVPRPEWITHGPQPEQYTDIPLRDRWAKDQLTFFGGAAVLLETHDIIQSWSGIRVRQPWADLDLWEFFLGLRAEVKHSNPRSKGLLREMLRGRVPDYILDRRDKTVFDDNLKSKMDRTALGRWLIDPPNRLPWINYALLAEAINKPELGIREFMWMKDLAAVQAFLETW